MFEVRRSTFREGEMDGDGMGREFDVQNDSVPLRISNLERPLRIPTAVADDR